MMDDLLDRLMQLESDVRYQQPPDDVEPELQYTAGGIPILLSAPHAAVHTRNGKPKEEDEFTAGFVRLIGEQTGAHVLYARRQSLTDPNWHTGVPYKARLRQVVESADVRLVLDIHGACVKREFGIGIGTMRGATCPVELPRIIESLGEYGFSADAEHVNDRLDVDGAFTATGQKGQETITRFVLEKLHVPSAQFELHPSLRIVQRREDASSGEPFTGDPGRIARAILGFIDIVGEVTAQALRAKGITQ